MRATLATNLLIQVITFGTSVLTARILGPIGRGELAVVLLYPQLVATMCMLGVDRAVAVRAGRGELARPALTLLALTALLTLPAATLAYAVIGLQVRDPSLTALSTQYIAYIPALYFFMLAMLLFNGIGDFSRFNRVRLGFYFTNLLALAIIWAMQPSAALCWIVGANIASVYAGMLLAAWFLLNSGPSRNRHRDNALAIRPVLAMALPFALPAAMGHFAPLAYQVVLEQRSSAGALGAFIVIYSFSRLLAPVGNALNSHVFHLGISGAQYDLPGAVRRGLIVYLGCALPLGLAAPWIIPAVFGRDFAVDPLLIAILLVACVFALAADTMAEHFKGRALVRTDTLALALSIAVTLCVGWWLVPHIGMVGMAVALVIADFSRFMIFVLRSSEDTSSRASAYWKPSMVDFIAIYQSIRLTLFRILIK